MTGGPESWQLGSCMSSIHRLGGSYGTDQTVYRLQECPCVREMRPSSWVEKSPHPQSRLVIGKSWSLWGQSPGSWGVVYRQSTGWGGLGGLSKLSTVTQNQGTAVPVRERTDPEVGLRNPQIPNPESGSESLGRCGGRILAVGESYIVKPQAGGVIWD